MTTDVKACKDCAHFTEPRAPAAICKSPNNDPNLVYGGLTYSQCAFIRLDQTKCGREAKWFVERPLNKGCFHWFKNL